MVIGNALDSIEQKEDQIMATLAEVQADLAALSTAVDAEIAAVNTAIAALKAQIASGSPDPAALQSIADGLKAAQAKLDAERP
jgi:chromosome segregation ATPase